MVRDNTTKKKWRRVYGGGANAVSKYCFFPNCVSRYSREKLIPAGSGRAVVRPVIGVCSGLYATNQPEQKDFPPGIRDLFRGGLKGAAEFVGGVGELPRIRVSCSVLSVVRGLLALGSFYNVLCRSLLCGCCLCNCTTDINIFVFTAKFLWKLVENQKLKWRAEGKLNRPQWRIVAIVLNVIGNQIKAWTRSRKKWCM